MSKDKKVDEIVDIISEMIIKYIADGRESVTSDKTEAENLQVA